ncbi:MAG: hypothetical protein AAF411_18715 [Myxococcota bacterium]
MATKSKKPAKSSTKAKARKAKSESAAKAPAKKAAAKKASKKKAAPKKAAARKTNAKDEAPEEAEAKPAKKTGAAAEAEAILASETPAPRIAELAEALLDSRSSVATKAARVLHEIVATQPEATVLHVERFARGLRSKHKRVVQTSADALPAIAKIAPARVAKHLDILKESFEPAILDGKDGLVRTFANLCTASVAYQKRLEPVLTLALETANGKSLLRWAQIVLPALKGEPHARARSVVEDRLDRIPRSLAQQIASTMNFKLRVRYR